MNKTLIAALAILSVGSVFSQDGRFFVSGVNSHEMKKQAGEEMTYYNALLDKVLIINEYSDLFLDSTDDDKTYKIKEPMCHDIKSIIGDAANKFDVPKEAPVFVGLDHKVISVQFNCSLKVNDRHTFDQESRKKIKEILDGGQPD